MLKKENYEVKGFVLPYAFAMAQVDTTREVATFYIGASREALLNGEYIDKKVQGFKWDRNENPIIAAYNKAKGQEVYEVENENGEKEIITKNGVLFGWVDDYTE